MAHYVGLDVSVRHTSICIVDDVGKVVREARVTSEPEAILPILTAQHLDCRRIGLEAGPLSQWLFNALASAGLPVICVETRHMKAALAAQINKTDRNDARGIAQMMRVGLYRPVHVKSEASQEKRTLLAARKLLQGQNRAIENDVRGLLRSFGLKVGPTSAGAFDARVRELVEGLPRLTAIVRPLLEARAVLRSQFAVLHRMLLDLVRDDPVCRRFMTVPGVGAVVAITFQATVDIPQRFVSSKAVVAHFGLTPRAFSSGETDYTGRISRCGDALMRATLYEAAHTLLTHTQRWSGLKTWERPGGTTARLVKSNSRGSPQVGSHSTPHVDRKDGVSLECESHNCLTVEGSASATRSPPGTMGEVSSPLWVCKPGRGFRSQHA